jgi:hypothetical protein
VADVLVDVPDFVDELDVVLLLEEVEVGPVDTVPPEPTHALTDRRVRKG